MKKGKCEEDLDGLPVIVIEHFMTEEELEARFGETERQPRIPCPDHDPGHLPGRKTAERSSHTGEAEPPAGKR